MEFWEAAILSFIATVLIGVVVGRLLRRRRRALPRMWDKP